MLQVVDPVDADGLRGGGRTGGGCESDSEVQRAVASADVADVLVASGCPATTAHGRALGAADTRVRVAGVVRSRLLSDLLVDGQAAEADGPDGQASRRSGAVGDVDVPPRPVAERVAATH